LSSPCLSASVLNLHDERRRAATIVLVTAWRAFRAAQQTRDVNRATLLFAASLAIAPLPAAIRKGAEQPEAGLFSRLDWSGWALAHGLRCTRGSLFRYAAAVENGEHNADGRGRHAREAADGTPDSQGQIRPGIDGPAWDLFTSLYLHGNRLTFAACWKFVRGQAHEHVWVWPSEPVVRRRIRADIPIPALIRFRRGERAAEAACTPKIARDIEALAAGECWALDGRTLDCWCRVSDARREWRRMRATVTGVLDVRSRCLRVDLRATECADGILAGIQGALRDWGAPREVICDNGEGYKAALGHRHGSPRQRALRYARIGSVFAALGGVTVHNAIVRHPWAKPIESIWNKVKRDFDAWFWHYWGGSPAERPEGRDAEIRRRIEDLPTEAELRALLDQWVREVYERTEQSGAGTRGLPPIIVMEQYRGTIRHVDESVIRAVCCRREGPVKVGRDGVRWRGFLFGQTQEEVYRLQGQRVWLLIDPERLDTIGLADLSERPILGADGQPLLATNRQLSGATQEQLAEAMRHKARCRRIASGYAPAQDYLRETSAAQVLQAKARHAAADLAALRERLAADGLPPPAEPPMTILRPDLSGALGRQRLRYSSATASAAPREDLYAADDGPAAPAPENTDYLWGIADAG